MECKKNVLVVEDAAGIREALCAMLEAAGFHARGCADGTSALEAVAQTEFHVIVVDYRMPNMNGAEATKYIRAWLPASLIIGVSSDDKKTDFLAVGADAFLLKPYRSADIINLIQSCF